jgi:hypothetical protein
MERFGILCEIVADMCTPTLVAATLLILILGSNSDTPWIHW